MPSQQPNNRCRCGKVKSSNLPAARLLHARIWARNGGSPEAFFYQCRWGYFHWTSDTEQTNHKPKAA